MVKSIDYLRKNKETIFKKNLNSIAELLKLHFKAWFEIALRIRLNYNKLTTKNKLVKRKNLS